jgi:hypothetical protein
MFRRHACNQEYQILSSDESAAPWVPAQSEAAAEALEFTAKAEE